MDADSTRAWQRCDWGEVVLRRHGWTGERLQKEARKIANDYIALHVPYMGERREDLVSFLVLKAQQSVFRFKPSHPTTSYGTQGGQHFGSWVCDIMQKRCVDWYRSKAEGNGDRRYGNDNRIVLNDDPDPADHDVDFSKIVSDRERSDWQRAAQATGWELDEWMKITLNKASKHVLRSAA